WAFWRFLLHRERYAKIEFNLDLNVLGVYDNTILVEAIAIVENKGLVRHWINDFKFNLHYLPEGGSLKEGDDRINKQVLFERIFGEKEKRYWIPPTWIRTFIDSGITQHYTYVTHVPRNAAFVLLYAEFKYPDKRSDYHTSQKVFNIQNKLSEIDIQTRSNNAFNPTAR
ncbi:MAG TPA: hypothetical protein VF700_11880, partial [Segetibacter sp.]